MLLLMAAGLVGGLVTFTALWSHGMIVALAAAPFGGSLLALATGLVVAFLRARTHRALQPQADAGLSDLKQAL